MVHCRDGVKKNRQKNKYGKWMFGHVERPKVRQSFYKGTSRVSRVRNWHSPLSFHENKSNQMTSFVVLMTLRLDSKCIAEKALQFKKRG